MDANHAISAAHCFVDNDGDIMKVVQVYAGVINFNGDSRHVQFRSGEVEVSETSMMTII